MIFLPSYSYYFLKVEIKKPDEDEGLVLKRNEERCLFATVFNEPDFIIPVVAKTKTAKVNLRKE
jgi:hypothetical protein